MNSKNCFVTRTMVDWVACFVLCIFPYCTFGGFSAEECNKEDFSKPYVKVFRKLSGAPEKVMTTPGFLDLYQYTNKIICLNGPMVVYDDATFSAARMMHSERSDVNQEDPLKKKRNAHSVACVPGENGVPPGFTCSYNGSGTGYLTPEIDPSTDPDSATINDDPTSTTETDATIMDFMPTTTTETDPTSTDATEMFIETSTDNSGGETKIPRPATARTNSSKTPDSYRGGKVLVFSHKCLVLNKLPKEEVLKQREEQNPLTYDRVEQIVPSTKKMGVYMLSVDMSDYAQPGIFQFERPNFEYRPRRPGTSTSGNTSHSFALIGTPEDNTFCYTVPGNKGKGTEIQMFMEDIPQAPQICTYAGGNDDSFDDIFRGRSKDGVKWDKCNLAKDERVTPDPNAATLFNEFAMLQKGGSGMTQSLSETPPEEDDPNDTTHAKDGTASKTVNRCTHAMVKENCTLFPVFKDCEDQTKTSDECIFLNSALGLDDTPPEEEANPEKELRKEVLGLVDAIFGKICKHIPPKLPSTVSGILMYYLKDKPTTMLHRIDTWKFLIGELKTCKSQAKPMKFKWDNTVITTDDDTDSHPNARKSSGGKNPIDRAPGYTGVINEGANNENTNISAGGNREKRSLDNFFTYLPAPNLKVIPASEAQGKSSQRKGRHTGTESKTRTTTLKPPETTTEYRGAFVETKDIQQPPGPTATTSEGVSENKKTVTHSIHTSKNQTSELSSSSAPRKRFSEKRNELLQPKVRVQLGSSNILQLVKMPISHNSTGNPSLGNLNLADDDQKYTGAFIDRQVRQNPTTTQAPNPNQQSGSSSYVPPSLPRPIIEVEDFEEQGEGGSESNPGNADTVPTNVKVVVERIERRLKREVGSTTNGSVEIPLFYYQEAAELEYMFNSAIDTHWKVFATVAGYCNKFYKARKSETFPRLYNSYFEDILEPVENIWKSPADNKALGIVISESTSESVSRWLDNCMEGSYIVADSKTYRPPRPLTVKENGEEKTNYFEEVPTEDDFVGENAQRALHGGSQTVASPQGRRMIGIGNQVKNPFDSGCHWSCDDNDQNCHKECGTSEKAGKKPKHKILHGPNGQKIMVEANIGSEEEKDLGNLGFGPATLGRYMALKKRARMIANLQKHSKSAKGRSLQAFNPLHYKDNQNPHKIINHSLATNHKARKAQDKLGVSRGRSANMKSRRISLMNAILENQSKKDPSMVGRNLGSDHKAQQKSHYVALTDEDLNKINSVGKRHTNDRKESVKDKADLDLKHKRRKVEKFGKGGPLHFKGPVGRKASERRLEVHKSTTAHPTAHALHLQNSVKRSTALHRFKKRKA